MDRSEGGIASRWTTDHSSVFFHLAFFIFMLVSIDFPFLLFPLPFFLFFPFPFLPPVINDNNCKESKEEKMDFVSYFFLTKETKKRREERRNVELTPYFIFVPFLCTFFSAFLSFSILSSYSTSSSPSFFPRLIFLLGTSSSLHHFSHDVFLDRFLSIPRTRNRYIFPTNTFVIVVKWWTSALASTMPVPSGLFIPVFKV